MLGRKTYTPEELANGKATVAQQLKAYDEIVKKAKGVSEDVQAVYFNNMVLVLDRYYVHRLRGSTGKDGNALNEVEMIADSLINNGGVLKGNNVIKYVAGEAMVKLEIGDRIRLTATDFERLAEAFFAELEAKFLS
jgi:hypothetical protein